MLTCCRHFVYSMSMEGCLERRWLRGYNSTDDNSWFDKWIS